MSCLNHHNHCSCTTAAIIVSAVIGIVAAILRFTGVITVTPAFLWVTFGIGVVYLALTLLVVVLRTTTARSCLAQTVDALLAGILGTILLSVILLAVPFGATSIWGAVLTGILIAFFTLLITMTACLVKCVADGAN